MPGRGVAEIREGGPPPEHIGATERSPVFVFRPLTADGIRSDMYFNAVCIMPYLFEGSILKPYPDMFGLSCEP